MPGKEKKSVEDFTELKDFIIDPESVQLLNYQYCLHNEVLVLGKVDKNGRDPVVIGCIDVYKEELFSEINSILKRDVIPVQLNDYEIKKALQIGFKIEDGAEGFRLELKPARELTFTADESVVNLLNEILGLAVYSRATDVHIESYEDDIDVRFRIDGTLHQITTALSRDNIQAAVSRLKILGGLDIMDKRHSQDGRIIAIYQEDRAKRNIDFRLSVVPGAFGEDAVMRILDSAMPFVGLEKLGFNTDIIETFKRLVSNPEGMLLVTGPTGSGKTTTLYSVLDYIRSSEKKIITVEDPIEYTLAKVNQKQITSAMGFADFARSFMRQNPDVIMIGEIRDEETADVAFRAAQTGHLVLSTVHTNDAVRSVARLRTLRVDASLIAGSLLGSLSQRLVRILCQHCRFEVAPDEKERNYFGLAKEDVHYFRSRGCDKCGQKGYKSRIGVFELFVPDDEIADMIATKKPIHEVRNRAREKGMKSLVTDALAKAHAGTTSLSEIMRVVPYRLITTDK